MKIEHAEQLYKQCSETYARCANRYDAAYKIDGIDIRCPNDFDDEFNVPAILLFQELCKSKKRLNDNYEAFRRNLLRAIYSKSDFNIQNLADLPSSGQTKRYEVYFEVFFQKEDNEVSPIFRRQLSVGDVKFRWCSKKTMATAFKTYHKHHKRSFGMPFSTIDQFRSLRFPSLTPQGEKHIHPIMTTVRAKNPYEAINTALSSFEVIEDAVNVVQIMGLQSIHLGGKHPANLTMITTGIYIANNRLDPSDSILCDSAIKIYELPKQKLSFTKNRDRISLFHEIIKASCDAADVSRRVRSVVSELALAYSSENSGLRQLSCWRCLEIATAKSGENRKEKDIIRIFQNYHSSKHWKQMGTLVMKARNTYVHQGKPAGSGGFSGDYYLNWSQQYAEKALLVLLYLYKHRATWRTKQQIDRFFDYYAEPNESLEVARRLLSARAANNP